MKPIMFASACALAALFAIPANAADWHDREEVYERIVDEPRVVVRERIIIREYVVPGRQHHVDVDEHENEDDDDDVVVVRRAPRHHHVHRYEDGDDWRGQRVIYGPGYRRVYYRD